MPQLTEIDSSLRVKVVLKKLLGLLSRLSFIDSLVKRLAPKGVFILCYHRIVDSETRNTFVPFIAVSRTQLIDHIKYLKKYFNPASLGDALRYLKEDKPLKEDLVVLTFDDGYRDNLSLGGPIFIQFCIKPAIFVTTACVEEDSLLWPDKLRYFIYNSRGSKEGRLEGVRLSFSSVRNKIRAFHELSKKLKRMNYRTREEFFYKLEEKLRLPIDESCSSLGGLMLKWAEVSRLTDIGAEIGSHTHTHEILSNLSAAEITEQLAVSKNLIEKHTRNRCLHFAYPNGHNGDFDDQSISILKSLGYESAVTLSFGSNLPTADLFRLKRIPVTLLDSADDLRFKVFRARVKAVGEKYFKN